MSENESSGRRVSPAFRSMLRRELDDWVCEGVVDADQSAAITKRYGLNDVAGRSGGLLVQALYLIGAFLIGGGAISFVASRWDEIPVSGRVALLVGTLLACEIAGFYLWKLSGSRKRLGEALIVLGTLVFGANVILIAEMFHLTGEPHGFFGIWALGAAAIAFATMSGPCMLVTCVASFAWFCGYTANNPHMLCWYPFAIVAACVPFLMRRSAAAFGGVILAAGAALAVCAGHDSGEQWPPLLAIAATATFLYGLGLRLDRIESARLMGIIARAVGMAVLLLLAYMMSFEEVAREFSKPVWRSDGWLWTAPLGLTGLAGVAVWTSVIRTPPEGTPLRHRSAATLAAGAVLIAGTLTMHPLGLPVAAKIAAGAIAVSLLYTAVRIQRRTSFWAGLLILAWVIIHTFIEWDTNLFLKSFVFIACGIGVILGGIRFERHLKQGEAHND